MLKSQSESKPVADQAMVSNQQPALTNPDSGLDTNQTTQVPFQQQPASQQPTRNTHQASASVVHQPNDLYGAAIINSMVAEQQHLRSSQDPAPALSSFADVSRRSDTTAQPFWNDP